jgi:hypothetical protein
MKMFRSYKRVAQLVLLMSLLVVNAPHSMANSSVCGSLFKADPAAVLQELRLDLLGALVVSRWNQFSKLDDLRRVMFINLAIGHAVESSPKSYTPETLKDVSFQIRDQSDHFFVNDNISGIPSKPSESPMMMSWYALGKAKMDINEITKTAEREVNSQTKYSQKYASMNNEEKIEFSNLLRFQMLNLLYIRKEQERDLRLAGSSPALAKALNEALVFIGIVSAAEQLTVPKPDAEQLISLSKQIEDASNLLRGAVEANLGSKSKLPSAEQSLLAKHYANAYFRLGQLAGDQLGNGITKARLSYRVGDGPSIPLFSPKLDENFLMISHPLRRLGNLQ